MEFFASKDGSQVFLDVDQIPVWQQAGYRIGIMLPYYLDAASELSILLNGGSIGINSVEIQAAGQKAVPLMARSKIQELCGTEHEARGLSEEDTQTVIKEVLGERAIVDTGTGPTYTTVKVDDMGRVISVEIEYEE